MLHSDLIWHHEREISLFNHQYNLASIQTLSSLKTGTPPRGGSWWSSFRGEYICFRGEYSPLRGGWINPWWLIQEIWANAHETRDSISFISAKNHSNCAPQPKIAKNSLKPPILGVQGRSRSSMLVPPESSSAVLVMIGSKYVSIVQPFSC